MSGNLLRVTAIGYGSTSLAYFGVMPHKAPASGKPPDPSNKLNSVAIQYHRPVSLGFSLCSRTDTRGAPLVYRFSMRSCTAESSLYA